MLERMATARADGFKAGTAETCCGPGSTLEYTRELRKLLPECFRSYNVKKLNDAGCGDLNWISHVDLEGIEYRGFDLFPHPGVTVLDITNQTMPKADMILCRDVLIHLPLELIECALAHFKDCAPLLLTTGYEKPEHHKLDTDAYAVKIDLSWPPFSLDPPMRKIPDGPGRWLGLWTL